MKHVVLVGLSGSGKSTIGRLLAARLGRPFVDTDELIVERASMPIPQLFVERGEPAFRTIERGAVEEAVAGPPAIIATGGGAPIDPSNRAHLWDGNLVVWLDAPVEALVQRVGVGGDGRPLLTGNAADRLAELRESRLPVYEAAHVRVETDVTGVDGALSAILDVMDNHP